MDAALRVVDDVGLTTGAAELADFDYWRAIKPAARNEPCPCRSGQKAKNCGHEWGGPAPAVPSTFMPEAEAK